MVTKPPDSNITRLYFLYLLVTCLILSVAAQSHFQNLIKVPTGALYLNLNFFSNWKTSISYLGLLSILQIIIYSWIVIRLFRLHSSDNSIKITRLHFVIIFLILFVAILTPAFTSSDIYYYLGIGRIQIFHNKNPFLDSISSVPHDPINSIGDWVAIPTMYAPALVAFFAGVAKVSGTNVLVHLFFYKIAVLFFYILSGYFIFLLSKQYSSKLSYVTALAFLFHPLAMNEILVNGHNDIIALAILLFSIYLLMKEKFIGSLFLFYLAGSFKFPALIIGPLYLLFIYRIQGRKVFLTFFLSGLAFIPILICFYFLYFQDLDAFNSYKILMAYWGPSTPSSIALVLNETGVFSEKHLILIIKTIKLSYIPFCLYRAFKINNKRDFLQEAALLLFFFYLLFSSYVWPWYLVNFLPFLWFRKNANYFWQGIALALGSVFFWLYYFLDPGYNLFWSFSIKFLLFFGLVFITLLPFVKKRLRKII